MPMPAAWQAGYAWGIDPTKHKPETIEKWAEQNGIEFGTPQYASYLRGIDQAQHELDEAHFDTDNEFGK